jgi:hypothetical protein
MRILLEDRKCGFLQVIRNDAKQLNLLTALRCAEAYVSGIPCKRVDPIVGFV